MANLPTHAILDDALVRAELSCSAAEAHGILCGLLALLPRGKLTGLWPDELLAETDPANALVRECRTLLEAMPAEVESRLNDTGMGFELLLPEDNESLDERAAALRDWCGGFLLGISLAGLDMGAALAPEAEEFLEDVVAISQSDAPEGDDDSAIEAALVELEEYLKVGTQLFREEMQNASSADASKNEGPTRDRLH